MLLALFFQGLVLNTHIHGTPLLYGITQIVSANNGTPADIGAPSDDQNSCPVCHQIAHAGQYVTPATSVPYAPIVTRSVIAHAIAAPFNVWAPSFAWQSRAPPRA